MITGTKKGPMRPQVPPNRAWVLMICPPVRRALVRGRDHPARRQGLIERISAEARCPSSNAPWTVTAAAYVDAEVDLEQALKVTGQREDAEVQPRNAAESLRWCMRLRRSGVPAASAPSSPPGRGDARGGGAMRARAPGRPAEGGAGAAESDWVEYLAPVISAKVVDLLDEPSPTSAAATAPHRTPS